MKRIFLTAVAGLLFSAVCLTSCVDLDISPTTVIQAENIFNENGIKAYLAGVYNYLPMEDFHYDTNDNGQLGGGYYVGNGLMVWNYWCSTGENVNRNNTGCTLHRNGYWTNGFLVIRRANTLIQQLPNYPDLATQSVAWIAEAKFLRAYVYFQLVKRYGGMPLIEEPQSVTLGDESNLWVARASHEETYDFILKDLDDAIAGLPETSIAGRANKYVAAALKSRAALHAATTARYGSYKFPDWEVEGVLLQGIPQERANDYFGQAWDAAKLVEDGGRYELHRANSDKGVNYTEIWEKSDSNRESIWLRQFDYSMTVHSYTTMMCPPRMATEGGDRLNPTLDWVELFDGLPMDENGHFSAFDEDGNYTVYDNVAQLWENVEPRLWANLLIPGSLYFGGQKLDTRIGMFPEEYDPDAPSGKFKKFTVDNGEAESGFNSSSTWNKTDYPDKNPFRKVDDGGMGLVLWSRAVSLSQPPGDLYTRPSDGLKLFTNGLDGPKINGNTGSNTITGFFGRKYLNLTKTRAQLVHQTSTESWIEMRYAEVLLNRAEAAIELSQNGVANHGGVDMLTDAYNCINDVRDRAGATLLTDPGELSTEPAYTNWVNPGPKGQGSFVEAPNRGLQIVRVERYKELAFESKLYWDLKRWFTFDTQIKNYRRRGLYAFMYSKGATVDGNGIPDGKVIYDAKSSEEGSGRVNFGNVNNYYEVIPSDQLRNNPLLQKNRYQ